MCIHVIDSGIVVTCRGKINYIFVFKCTGRDRPPEEAEPPKYCKVHRHDPNGRASPYCLRVSCMFLFIIASIVSCTVALVNISYGRVLINVPGFSMKGFFLS